MRQSNGQSIFCASGDIMNFIRYVLNVKISFLYLLFFSFNSNADLQYIQKVDWPVVPGHIVYFPSDYALKPNDKFPLLIFLHGVGERGNGTTELSRITSHGPIKKVIQGTWDKSLPFIIVSPQLSSSQGGWFSGDLNTIYNYATSKYRVDLNRVYISGLSLGGMGTFNSLTVSGLNSKIAAVLPICGRSGLGVASSSACDVVKNMGFWAFHGEQDTIVTYSDGVKSVEDVKKCNPNAKLTTYPNTWHDSWTRTYDNDLAGATHVGGDGRMYSDIYRWLLSFSLNQVQQPIQNRKPVISAIADVSVAIDNQVIVPVQATDEDFDIMSISFQSALPSFVSFRNTINGAGELLINPKSGNEGNHTITVIVKDDEGLSDQKSFNVSVVAESQSSSSSGNVPVIRAQGPVSWGGFGIFCDPSKSMWQCSENVSLSGNNKLEFEIRKLPANQVNEFVIRIQDRVVGVKEVPLKNFITLSEQFQKVSIPFSNFGVSSLSQLIFVAFRAVASGKSIDIELRDVRFAGGSSPFVYFGEQRPQVGLSKELLTSLEITYNYSAQQSSSAPSLAQPIPTDEPVLSAKGPVSWGGFSIFCDPSKSMWQCTENVSIGGNNKLEFEIKKLPLNQVDEFMVRIQDRVTGVKEVPLKNFITLSDQYQKVSIPLSSFGVSGLNQLIFITFRAIATGKSIDLEVKNIRFTGGLTPFHFFSKERRSIGLDKELLSTLEVR